MTLPTPVLDRTRHWVCLALVDQGETFERCGAPAICVDPVFGGPVCESHRRTNALQNMTCCTCQQQIKPGDSFEFSASIEKRRKGGNDPLICQPCLLKLIRETLELFKRVSPAAWDDSEIATERP